MELISLQMGLTRSMAILIAASIGFIGGILSSFGLYWLRGRRRKRSLRRAIRTELEIPADAIERAHEQGPVAANGPFHADIPTTMYESQAIDLGRLSKEEMKPLIAYYSTAYVAKKQLSNLDDDAVAERFFQETVPILIRTRKEAVEALDEHL